MRTRLALVLAALAPFVFVACGARTELRAAATTGAAGAASSSSASASSVSASSSGGVGGSSSSAISSSGGCVVTPVTGPFPTCTAWSAGGSPVEVSGAISGESMAYLTAAIPSAGGVLVSWFTLDDSARVPWNTRAIHFDGSPRSPIRKHLSFPTIGGVYVGVMSLAGSGCTFGGIVDATDEGCRFLSLDQDGRELGVPAAVADGCTDLGVAGAGFSLLSPSPSAIGLTTVTAQGGPLADVMLGAAGGYYGRFVLPDQSFLLGTVTESDAGLNAVALQHFSASGKALAPAAPLTDDAGSILYVAPTPGGALVSWLGSNPGQGSGEAIVVRPVDADGTPTAAAAALAATGAGPIYGSTIAPTPNGDALLSWFELDEATNDYELYVMALGPDGTPRGARTDLGTFGGIGNVFVEVAPDGETAVLVAPLTPTNANGGVQALPLRCSM